MKQRLLVSSNFSSPKHRIDDEVASVFGSSAVDRGFEPRSGQPKDYNFFFYFIKGRFQLILKIPPITRGTAHQTL
jgi:hypothetical protein